MKLSLKLIIAVTLCVSNLSVGWAQRQYPGSPGLPDDVVWMREIYRTLDLTKDTNGALYYPVEPQGNKMNLFTTMFRLLAQKKIPAYAYQLDGTERFQKDAEVTFRDVLDRFQIYYELKKKDNCYKYGFIVRYPKGKENYTGYDYEPWHLRYVGRELATKLHDSGQCLEEYLGIISEYSH